MITKEQREKIKKNLLKGDMSIIARNLNMSKSAVYYFFRGEGENLRILNEAVSLVERRKDLANKVDKW